jgi:glycosyltransferase involved in cell wall biosynthesis
MYRKMTSNPWDLVILGDGELMPRVKERIGNPRLQGNIVMPGFKQYDETPFYYALSDCYIQASTSEQWGLVVNEAMASSLPVLVSRNCGCCEDLLREGENGFSFDPLDIQDIADKMIRICDEGCDRVQMGKVSRQIISTWGCENFGENLWEAAELAYRQPLKRSNTPASLILKHLTFTR